MIFFPFIRFFENLNIFSNSKLKKVWFQACDLSFCFLLNSLVFFYSKERDKRARSARCYCQLKKFEILARGAHDERARSARCGKIMSRANSAKRGREAPDALFKNWGWGK